MANARIMESGSGAFSDVGSNRDSLQVVPSRLPDESCVHEGVVAPSAPSLFSAQRGHPVHPVKLPSKVVSLSIGELAPGTCTSNHRHAYEALMYVIAGKGYSLVEGQRFDWQAGDAVYTPPWCWHQHFAQEGHAVQYITATNMPLLNSLGQTVMREEARTEDSHQ